jgi:YHS domain-containing protein
MHEHRAIAPNEDPVCGMTIEPEVARAAGRTITHEDVEYVFCGKGCMLDFQESPETYLAAGHLPTM